MKGNAYDFEIQLSRTDKKFIFDMLVTVITNLGLEPDNFQEQPLRIMGLNPLAGYTKTDLKKAISLRNRMVKASKAADVAPPKVTMATPGQALSFYISEWTNFSEWRIAVFDDENYHKMKEEKSRYKLKIVSEGHTLEAVRKCLQNLPDGKYEIAVREHETNWWSAFIFEVAAAPSQPAMPDLTRN